MTPRPPNTTAVHLHAKRSPMRRTGALQPILPASDARAEKLQQLRPVLPASTARHGWRTGAAYTCPELHELPPGVPPERMAAFALPSRMGSTLRYPDGRSTPLTTEE